MKRALFPISLSNDVFSTEKVVPAMKAVASKYSDVFILIADKIQIYNRVAIGMAEEEGAPLSFSRTESSIQRVTEQRERWLDRVKLQLGPEALHCRWRVFSVQDIADRVGFQIFRRVLVLYDIDQKFRADVQNWARRFTHNRVTPIGGKPSELAERMSIRYILEEAALSVRMRVCNKVHDEYYLGKSTEPIVSIYRGKYMTDCWDLAGVSKRKIDFAFFEITPHTADTWHAVT